MFNLKEKEQEINLETNGFKLPFHKIAIAYGLLKYSLLVVYSTLVVEVLYFAREFLWEALNCHTL